jgi:rhamnosyltransferase subunit B
MRIVLTAVGTAGDVYPFIGLGVDLKGMGHEVLLVTHSPFAEPALRAGLGFIPIGSDLEYTNAIRNNSLIWDPTEGYAEVARCALAIMPELYSVLLDNIYIPDTIIVAHYLDFASPLIQTTFDVPVITALTSPVGLQFGDQHLAKLELPEPLRVLRDEVGDGWNLSRVLTLGLFPQWFGSSGPSFPRPIMFAGFPLYDTVGETPPQVENVLSGSAPVTVFSLGSRAVADAVDSQQFIDAAGEACGILDVNGLILGVPPGSSFRSHASLVEASFAPLSKVLPRTQAIVHHGGVGTIATAMATGTPQLAIPLCHDQPENTKLMVELGVGACLPYSDYDARTIAEQLGRLVGSSEVQERCKQVQSMCSGMDAAKSLSAAIDFIGRGDGWRQTQSSALNSGLDLAGAPTCSCGGVCGAGWG